MQAVRNISFDLYDGETLAIIGESGSGKSVTSRAIMGILAGNAVVESGSILYDGKDLLKLKEESFHKIRGDKIAMIFQDPMSSLNPIMKVGKQLTEAMLLKGKTSQRRSRSEFNEKLKLLNSFIDESYGGSLTPEIRKKSRRLCRTFDSFCVLRHPRSKKSTTRQNAQDRGNGTRDQGIFISARKEAEDERRRKSQNTCAFPQRML